MAAAALGAVYFSWSAVLLWRLRTQGDSTGWDGLIAALGLMLGGGMLVTGMALTAACHVAFKGWRDQHPRPVFAVAVLMTVVGATFWMPYAWMPYRAPLDLYLMLLRLAILAWGLLLLRWAARRH